MFEFEKEEGKNWIAEIRKYGALERNHKMRRITVYNFNSLLLAWLIVKDDINGLVTTHARGTTCIYSFGWTIRKEGNIWKTWI